MGFPGGSIVKNPLTNAGDTRDVGSIPGSGRSPGGGNGNLLQDSCQGNATGRGAWQAAAHRGHKRIRHYSADKQHNRDAFYCMEDPGNVGETRRLNGLFKPVFLFSASLLARHALLADSNTFVLSLGRPEKRDEEKGWWNRDQRGRPFPPLPTRGRERLVLGRASILRILPTSGTRIIYALQQKCSKERVLAPESLVMNHMYLFQCQRKISQEPSVSIKMSSILRGRSLQPFSL